MSAVLDFPVQRPARPDMFDVETMHKALAELMLRELLTGIWDGKTITAYSVRNRRDCVVQQPMETAILEQFQNPKVQEKLAALMRTPAGLEVAELICESFADANAAGVVRAMGLSS